VMKAAISQAPFFLTRSGSAGDSYHSDRLSIVEDAAFDKWSFAWAGSGIYGLAYSTGRLDLLSG